ncbi:hypothetical protein HJFPF1_07036 [Paramyrothecium foliicola]|nr:hypothetical protein HJFPF1_07036 [Paramyrothecium foliicola]
MKPSKKPSAQLPCPMCHRNPEHYDDVEDNCKSLAGFHDIAVLVQHVIGCHIVCPECKKPLVSGNGKAPKSQIDFQRVRDQHECVPQSLANGKQRHRLKFLTPAQVEAVMRWSRKSASQRIAKDRDLTDQDYYNDLYEQLHGDPPGPDGARWSYWTARYKKDEAEAALKHQIAEIDRKLAAKQQEVNELKQELIAAKSRITELTCPESIAQDVRGAEQCDTPMPDATLDFESLRDPTDTDAAGEPEYRLDLLSKFDFASISDEDLVKMLEPNLPPEDHFPDSAYGSA